MGNTSTIEWTCLSCGFKQVNQKRNRVYRCRYCDTKQGVVRNVAVIIDPKFRFGPHHNNLP